ncbi:MAG: hypothetical protein A2X13_07385 [Bacteroidetes bacterium GWC2_33_15]|nr:MAG: hypothetical protein A2X10_01240 [Bacteroidetes bacterium GWA2_33_15]OFX48609.1 MAG: hypothetical protein A2X13_07385 [Bacteroidetes bacterium GWC2_33_15]OFX64583.1 MAG: hypothetical protein A2X15_04975 [Bacteroidetes bacterium GWB2_32_14]OFX67999.1 MAG: hypothetical protein A2X14_01800 [Bacteroidetes bacterium GWD2_33_33]HAN18233.1 hypothetical protein [Bacteroidales bacterium]
MIYLILSILSSTAIYIIFKYADKFKINTFDIIIINYITASILGFIISDIHNLNFSIFKNEWFPYSALIGVLFILLFVVIAKSSQVVGIAVTTVSNKMSVIIPIIVSIIIDPLDVLTNLKTIGIILALIAVFLTIYRKRNVNFQPHDIYLPVILFLGMGLVDSLVKFAQQNFVNDSILALFTVVLFMMAATTGIITKIILKTSFKNLINSKTFLWGVALGISNYGSLYFIIRALNHKTNSGNTFDGSIVFGINNLGVIALSVLFGLIFFKEKLLKINWIGISIACVAIYILSKT